MPGRSPQNELPPSSAEQDIRKSKPRLAHAPRRDSCDNIVNHLDVGSSSHNELGVTLIQTQFIYAVEPACTM